MCACCIRQVNASWKREFKFETTVAGQLLSGLALPLAVQVALSVGKGVMVCTDVQHQSFTLRTARDVASVSVSTESLPILGSPLGARVSVVGAMDEAADDSAQQAVVTTSPLRVRNEGIDVMFDLSLEGDFNAPHQQQQRQKQQQVRVSVVRPQLVGDWLEISRIEVAAGALR